mgnify:CR=1 FL=1
MAVLIIFINILSYSLAKQLLFGVGPAPNTAINSNDLAYALE